jgi:hypothetical protein
MMVCLKIKECGFFFRGKSGSTRLKRILWAQDVQAPVTVVLHLQGAKELFVLRRNTEDSHDVNWNMMGLIRV